MLTELHIRYSRDKSEFYGISLLKGRLGQVVQENINTAPC